VVTGPAILRRYQCAYERPAKHCHQVAKKQPAEYIAGRSAPADKQGAYDELRAGDVFAGEQTGKVPAGLQFLLGYRFPVKLVQSVEPFG
jgi:hypothetical protein